MSPKPILVTLFCFLLSTILFAQNKNPFESIGKKGKILTLSKGQYEELFDQDSIQQIGTALVNVRQMKVVKLLKDEEAKKLLDNSTTSRFLSVDPISKDYPELTPYQFASNRPIDGIDLDGLEYAEAKWAFDVFVKPFLNFGYGSVEYSRGSVQKATAQTNQASYQNSSVPQYVQDRLAKQDIAEGTSKQINGTTEMVVATAEVTSTYAPLGAEAMLAVKAPRLAAKPAKWVLRAAVEETPRPFGYESWGSETIGNGVRSVELPIREVKLPGSGPSPGVFEVSTEVKSVAATKNYYPSNPIEFVYDPTNKKFLVGQPNQSIPGLSGHQQLVKVGGLNNNKVVGGMFKRGSNGEIITNEFSGHYYQNWTDAVRKEFKEFLQKQTGLQVQHNQ